MTQTAGRLYTVAEFEQMPESEGRYELLNGRLVEKPVPKFAHSRIVDRIRLAYYHFDPDETLGVMLSEISVFIRDDYSPAPDLSFWVASRRPDFDAATAPYPDLAIEVQSPGQALEILTDKASEYIKAGVRLVWIIQPSKQRVLIYSSNQTRPTYHQPPADLVGDDVLPGFTLPLSRLFEKK
jgi:Uma2 family endonuclease